MLRDPYSVTFNSSVILYVCVVSECLTVLKVAGQVRRSELFEARIVLMILFIFKIFLPFLNLREYKIKS
jgi:hypothetical protein